jgi:hypothetical protein
MSVVGWEAVMTPLKAGQGAAGRLLSAVLSYSETLCSMLVVEQLHDSGHVEITEVLVDRPLEHIPNRAYSRHRRISSCSFHGVAKSLNLIFRQFTQLVVKGLNISEVVGAKCPVNVRPIRHVA